MTHFRKELDPKGFAIHKVGLEMEWCRKVSTTNNIENACIRLLTTASFGKTLQAEKSRKEEHIKVKTRRRKDLKEGMLKPGTTQESLYGAKFAVLS